MTIHQQRAAFALAKVKGIQTERDKFKTELLKLPTRLHTNGFGQTVAFYLSAGPNKPATVICSWLQAWLQDAGIHARDEAIIEAITAQKPDSESRYRRASAETRELAVWLKRFAEAFL